MFDQKEFEEFAVTHAVEFLSEPLTLASGRKSHWYINWRNVVDDVFLANKLSDYVVEFVKQIGLNPDCFYGVPEGSTKLAILIQDRWAKMSPDYRPGSHCLPMGRSKPKNHGEARNRNFIGVPRGRIIVLEDVTSTGRSLIEECFRVLQLNDQSYQVNIIGAISLTDRMELTEQVGNLPGGTSVEQALRSLDITFDSMTNAFNLLPRAYQLKRPTKDIVDAINREYKEYGVVDRIL